MMKTLTSLLLAGILVAAPITLTQAHQHSDKAAMPMMDAQMMEKMQIHLDEMRNVLDAVKKETDPNKRDAMLSEHAQKMQNMMTMMHGADSKKSKDEKGMEQMHSDMSTKDKMAMMENRMSMMEEMMVQMMGHTAEKSKSMHKHKKN